MAARVRYCRHCKKEIQFKVGNYPNNLANFLWRDWDHIALCNKAPLIEGRQLHNPEKETP